METKTTKPASSNPARRSISIFSRRGCDKPSPVFENLDDPNLTKLNNGRWKRRVSGTPKATEKPKTPKARPQSVATSISALEMEKAASSHEVVLKNISMSPALAFMNTEPVYVGPKKDVHVQNTKIPMRKPLKSKELESWNASVLHAMGPYMERPKTSDGSSASNSRPKIQVVIPSRPKKTFPPMPFQSNSESRPKIQTHSFSEISPPTVTSQQSAESFTVSAISPSANTEVKLERMMSVRRPSIKIHAEEPVSLNQYLQVPVHEPSNDGSSNDSISGDEDNISGARSQRSSVTSFDSQEQVPVEAKAEETTDEEDFRGHKTSKSESSIPKLGDLIHLLRTPSTSLRPSHPNRSLSSGNVSIPRTLPESFNEDNNRPPSPTLSEAERNLETQLSNMSPTTSEVVESWLQEELTREFSIKRKPPPPPKSEKRMSRASSICSTTTIASSIQEFEPQVAEQPLRNTSLRRSSSVRSVLSLIAEDDERQISSDEAECVIYMILASTHDLDDLFSLALINGGFYKVVKQHELELMRLVLRNMSPAAWEFRELFESWDMSATKFFKDYIADSDIIGNIKILILERCQSILRPDIVKALAKVHNPFRASKIDDALWRIWTFCKLFGGQKSREEDVAAQIDWLRGGTETRTASSTVDEFLDSEYAAYEHFGQGNQGGLTAEELYDITELWNCVRTISQGVIGRTEQARQHGVFDDTEVRGGDIDGEEIMLEEWHSYLMTQGLSVIYEMSKAATSLFAFSVAKRNRWTRWSPPTNGVGRRRFLLDPCGRLYEERISNSLPPTPEIEGGERRSVRRRRRESFADEIRQRKAQKSESNELPDAEEKLMSRANSVLEQLSSPSSNGPSPFTSPYVQSAEFLSAVSPMASPGVPPILVHSPSRPPPTPPVNKRKDLRIPTNLPILAASSSPSLPSPSMPSTPPPAPIPMHISSKYPEPTFASPYFDFSHSPAMPSRPAPLSPVSASMQHPFQAAIMSNNDLGVNTGEKAIFRIVEMGFTVEDAKTALKKTDMGDGLRIDRAVEFLLRQQDAL